MSASKSQILNFIKGQFIEGDMLQAYQIYFKVSDIESSMIKLEK